MPEVIRSIPAEIGKLVLKIEMRSERLAGAAKEPYCCMSTCRP